MILSKSKENSILSSLVRHTSSLKLSVIVWPGMFPLTTSSRFPNPHSSLPVTGMFQFRVICILFKRAFPTAFPVSGIMCLVTGLNRFNRLILLRNIDTVAAVIFREIFVAPDDCLFSEQNRTGSSQRCLKQCSSFHEKNHD
jgi:hypothetical protein